MDILPTRAEFGPSDQSWLGSRHAVDNAETGQLDKATTHIRLSVLPSGTALHRKDDEFWEPVTSSKQSVDGFLLTDQDNKPGEVVPILWQGRVRVDRLPNSNNGVDLTKCEHPQFVLVHEVEGAE